MKEEFIPYEEALALKELGFNEHCFGFYDYDNKPIGGDFPCDGNNSSPLYQQAFRWFGIHHKHRYYVERIVEVTCDDYINFRYVIYNIDVQQVGTIEDESPSDAELKCLKKLIKIAKQKI